MRKLVMVSMLGCLVIPSLALAHNSGTTSYSIMEQAGHLMDMMATVFRVINPGITL